MSDKMECHTKWNVTQNLLPLKMECHSKYNFTKRECHLNEMSIKLVCHSNWNVTQIGISL